jgi:hypothetical protein
MSAGKRVRGRVARGLAGCLLLAMAMAGCTSGRSTLGTSDDSCYLALPTATSAVRSHGRLVGVHLFTLKTLRQRTPGLLKDLDTTYHASQRVCVIAFSGDFRKSSVTRGRGQASGRVAVVVSTTPGNHLLGTAILGRTPLHFGHPHVG